ncbi:hypothetical protein V2W45_412909 [Cenococcum geophilum]
MPRTQQASCSRARLSHLTPSHFHTMNYMCLVGAILPTTYILEINQYHTAEGFTGETSDTSNNSKNDNGAGVDSAHTLCSTPSDGDFLAYHLVSAVDFIFSSSVLVT